MTYSDLGSFGNLLSYGAPETFVAGGAHLGSMMNDIAAVGAEIRVRLQNLPAVVALYLGECGKSIAVGTAELSLLEINSAGMTLISVYTDEIVTLGTFESLRIDIGQGFQFMGKIGESIADFILREPTPLIPYEECRSHCDQEQ